MSEEYAALITNLPLFEGYTVHGARFILESGEVREYQAGEVLCREGDAATFAFLVLSGKVQVFVERQGRMLVLNQTGPGAIMGELGVLCGIPRAACMRASERLVVLYWSTEEFRRMLLSNTQVFERLMRQTLRTLIEKEQALIAAVCEGRDKRKGH